MKKLKQYTKWNIRGSNFQEDEKNTEKKTRNAILVLFFLMFFSPTNYQCFKFTNK
jgi:hypothetical protein